MKKSVRIEITFDTHTLSLKLIIDLDFGFYS